MEHNIYSKLGAIICLIFINNSFLSCSKEKDNENTNETQISLAEQPKNNDLVQTPSDQISENGHLETSPSSTEETISTSSFVIDPTLFRWKNPNERYDDLVFLSENEFSIMRTEETSSKLYGQYKIDEAEIILFNFEINELTKEDSISLNLRNLDDGRYELSNIEYNLNYQGERK